MNCLYNNYKHDILCKQYAYIFFTSDLKYHCEFFFIFFNLSFLKWNVCVVFPCSNRATKFPEIKAKLPFCPRNKIAHLNRSRSVLLSILTSSTIHLFISFFGRNVLIRIRQMLYAVMIRATFHFRKEKCLKIKKIK